MGIGDSREKGISLLVITGEFFFKKEDISDGISYRYVGLYSNVVSLIQDLNPKPLIRWFAVREKILRYIMKSEVSQTKRTGTGGAILGFLFKSFIEWYYPVLLLAYPYGIPPLKNILEWGLTYLAVTFLARIGWLILVIDNSDPPEIVERCRVKKYPAHRDLYRRTLGRILFPPSLYLTVSRNFLRYAVHRFGLNFHRTLFVPNGLISGIEKPVSHISPSNRVIYGGGVTPLLGLDKLIETFWEINKKRKVELHLFGKRLMDIPTYTWLFFVKEASREEYVNKGLVLSDVALIPYPRNDYTCGTILAKVFDYMEAGLPIVMFDIGESAELIRKSGCGLIARNWDEFSSHTLRLLDNPALRRKLGEAGRHAVKEYHYDLIAARFVKHLYSLLKGIHPGEGE